MELYFYIPTAVPNCELPDTMENTTFNWLEPGDVEDWL